MSDKFYPISIKQLLQIILKEYQTNKSIFGIPEELFFNPIKVDKFNEYAIKIATWGVVAKPLRK